MDNRVIQRFQDKIISEKRLVFEYRKRLQFVELQAEMYRQLCSPFLDLDDGWLGRQIEDFNFEILRKEIYSAGVAEAGEPMIAAFETRHRQIMRSRYQP